MGWGEVCVYVYIRVYISVHRGRLHVLCDFSWGDVENLLFTSDRAPTVKGMSLFKSRTMNESIGFIYRGLDKRLLIGSIGDSCGWKFPEVNFTSLEESTRLSDGVGPSSCGA